MTDNGTYPQLRRSERQRYQGEDCVVESGQWWCEHTDETRRLMDESDPKPTHTCPDCGTVYACWTYGPRRLAKPVVMRVEL